MDPSAVFWSLVAGVFGWASLGGTLYERAGRRHCFASDAWDLRHVGYWSLDRRGVPRTQRVAGDSEGNIGGPGGMAGLYAFVPGYCDGGLGRRHSLGILVSSPVSHFLGYEVTTLTVTVRIARTSGEQVFAVESLAQQTVLDALFYIQNELDPTVSFRCSCRVGMCGSCGMVINGKEGLACRTSLKPLGGDVTLQPLRHVPVIKDLVVDMEGFFSKYRMIEPYLQPRSEIVAPIVAPLDSHIRQEIDLGLECISCGLCLSACDVVGMVPEFLGPAALNRAYNLIADVRDDKTEERLRVVGQSRAGVWQCHTHMSCVEVCPKNIAPTRAIAHLKRTLIRRRVVGPKKRPIPKLQRILQEEI